MSSPPSKLTTILAELKLLSDPELRAEWLIDYAGRFRPVPESIAVRPYPCERRVPGCESEVYVWSRVSAAGAFEIFFAVENPQGLSAKALAAILSEGIAGEPAASAAEIDSSIVHDIFGSGIGMGKGQGLMGMVNAVRAEARSHLPSA